jgi:hypothetical protein
VQVFLNTCSKTWGLMESIGEVSGNNTGSTCEVSCNSTESTARTRFRRGMSLKAVVAKAAGWTLEKAKDVTLPEIKECKTT